MRVSAAAWSRVMPFFSRCARSVSPSRDISVLLGAWARAVDLAHLSRSLRRSDDAVLLHDVDEPPGAREPDRHLPLQHRHRRLTRALHDLYRLLVAVVVDL